MHSDIFPSDQNSLSRVSLPCAMPQAGCLRNRLNLNRPPFNSPTHVYPTPSPPTTPVTLQQPSSISFLGPIFYRFRKMLPRDISFPVAMPGLHWHEGSFGTGLIPMPPGDLPRLSTRDVTTRRAHSPPSSSKYLHTAVIPPFLYFFGSYRNAERCHLHRDACRKFGRRPFPLLRIDGSGS